MNLICKLLIAITLLLSTTYASEKSPTRGEVSKLYVATFDRAPDSRGLNYWVNSGLTLSQIAQSFFDQPETKALYPVGISSRDFINSVYHNLFNRKPDTAGWDYWEDKLNGTNNYGNNKELTKITKNLFIQTAINGAEANTGSKKDATILNNKNEVGLAFANAGLGNNDNPTKAMSGVTDERNSVDFILAKIATGSISANVWGSYFEWVMQTGTKYEGNTIDTATDNDGNEEHTFSITKKDGARSRAQINANGLKFEKASSTIYISSITRKAYARFASYKYGITLNGDTASATGVTGANPYYLVAIQIYGKNITAYMGVEDADENWVTLDSTTLQDYNATNANWDKSFDLAIQQNGENGSFIVTISNDTMNASATLNVPTKYSVTVPLDNNGGVSLRGEIDDRTSEAGDSRLVFTASNVVYEGVEQTIVPPALEVTRDFLNGKTFYIKDRSGTNVISYTDTIVTDGTQSIEYQLKDGMFIDDNGMLGKIVKILKEGDKVVGYTVASQRDGGKDIKYANSTMYEDYDYEYWFLNSQSAEDFQLPN